MQGESGVSGGVYRDNPYSVSGVVGVSMASLGEVGGVLSQSRNVGLLVEVSSEAGVDSKYTESE